MKTMERMEHISLYRKWRPQTFAEVVGQPHVTNTLTNALASDRLVHAYLFCGPRGTGKTSTARILAKAINCVEGPTAVPCNACEACLSISRGNALDVIEIDAASNRKIDEMRELLDKIPYTPTALRMKVYIIDEVHQLSNDASSALLKTLEEPPGHVVFVLATTEPHKILPTIVSRCQKFDFTLVPTQEISGLLSGIASHEGIDIEAEAVGMIAEHAHGSVRDAIGVMDQISSLSGERVTQGEVADLLGEVESALVLEMVDLISEKDTPGTLTLVGRMVDSGKEPRRFVESLISHLRSLFLIQNAANPREIVEATDEHYEKLEKQARRLKRYEVVRLIERLGETHREMRWSESARLVLECALVKATSLDADVSLEGVLFRLEELERKVDGLGAAGPGTGAAAGTGLPGGRKEPGGSTPGIRAKGGASTEPVMPPPAVTGDEKKAPRAGTAKTGELARPAKKTGAGEKTTLGGQSRKQAQAGSAEERQKAKGAWKAVLGDLKSQGQMRLYALLTKAKIVDAKGEEVVLGFPEDASFQLEILKEPGQMDKVESSWAHFLGSPVRLTLTTIEEGDRARAAEKNAIVFEPPEMNVSDERNSDRGSGAPEEASVEEAPSEEVGEPERQKGSARELAERIKESFDGEIIQ
jgi:DNA polymerase-3 subunit gamma/tau